MIDAGAGLRARVDARDAAPSPVPAMPSTCEPRGGRSRSAADVFGRDRRLRARCATGRRSRPAWRRSRPARPAAPCAATTRPPIGADQHRVGAAPCGPARRRPAPPRSVARAPASVEIEVSSAGRRDEALGDQRAVVLERALRDVELRRASTTRSARPGAASSSSSVVSSWPSTWPALTRVAFAHGQRLHLGGDLAPCTIGAVDRLQPARDRRACAAARAGARRRRRSGARSSAGRRLRRRGRRAPARLGAPIERAADEAADDRERDHRRAATSASASSRDPLLACAACRGRSRPAPLATRASAGRAAPGRSAPRSPRFGSSMLADRAGAERMLVHDQEQQRRHQRMDHVGDVDRRGTRRGRCRAAPCSAIIAVRRAR